MFQELWEQGKTMPVLRLLTWHPGAAAEDEDSYTKEETKTPRFVNLVHAASIQKQATQNPPAQQAPAVNGHTPRGAAHEEVFAQQSAEQMERSGLVTSSLPEPLEQQVMHLGSHTF
jgi:hypothetical protein